MCGATTTAPSAPAPSTSTCSSCAPSSRACPAARPGSRPCAAAVIVSSRSSRERAPHQVGLGPHAERLGRGAPSDSLGRGEGLATDPPTNTVKRLIALAVGLVVCTLLLGGG